MATRLMREVEVRTPETLVFLRQGQISEIVKATEPKCMDRLYVPGAGWGQGDRYALVSADPAGDEMRPDLMLVRDAEKGTVYIHERPASLRVFDWLWVAKS